jgi:16S rRNA processing protein RimM
MSVDRLEVGYVARAHGLSGEVRVHLHAHDGTSLLGVDHIYLDGSEMAIESARPNGDAVLLLLEGIGDRNAAEALRGKKVEIDRDAVPLEPGEYLLADLPGCTVIDTAGVELGKIVEVMAGPQPILVIHGDGRERLLPAVPTFVLEVDTAARRVTVELPEDLPAEPI